MLNARFCVIFFPFILFISLLVAATEQRLLWIQFDDSSEFGIFKCENSLKKSDSKVTYKLVTLFFLHSQKAHTSSSSNIKHSFSLMIANHFGFVSAPNARKKELLPTSVTSISQLLSANDLFYFGLKTVKKPFAKDKKKPFTFWKYVKELCFSCGSAWWYAGLASERSKSDRIHLKWAEWLFDPVEQEERNEEKYTKFWCWLMFQAKHANLSSISAQDHTAKFFFASNDYDLRKLN